ncbi:MAG: tetratricopeptide repeat protein [Lutibacter sp.]|jgi:tetratricopeptide (TPR) repeat protein
MRTIRITRSIMLLMPLLFTTLVHAQIENDVSHKTYYPTLQQISREQLIAKINENLGDITNYSYNEIRKSNTDFFSKGVVRITAFNNGFQDHIGILFYYKEIYGKKIKLSKTNHLWEVILQPIDETKTIPYGFSFKTYEIAIEFAENMYYILNINHLVDDSLIKKDSILFIGLVAQYKEMKVKPTITEGQRKYIVQANAYSKDKDFEKAIEAYQKTIALDPLAYPTAYYNMALLYAETGDFNLAIRNMKKYLLLLPDAPDARAAQDKIYEWER